MYAVEVNLLKDRPGYRQEVTTRPAVFGALNQGPLLLGVVFSGGFLGLTLAGLLVLTFLNQRLTAREQELDVQLAQLAPELAKVESFQAQEQQMTAETSSLASVFNQIKPWSATLRDIGDRVPAGLQITSIKQAAPAAGAAAGATPSPSPSPAPAAGAPAAGAPAAAPTGELAIQGNALSFSDINDFELTLQKSPFLKSEATQLIQSQREEATQPGARSLATYQIQSSISDVPASELLLELNRKGAIGLVTRIQTLKEKGVIQP